MIKMNLNLLKLSTKKLQRLINSMGKTTTLYLKLTKIGIIIRLPVWVPFFYHSKLRMIMLLSLSQLHV